MAEEETIRARRIELEDDNGDVRVVLDGDGSEEGHVGMIVFGPDGPVSAVTIGFGGSASPSVFLQGDAGGTVQIDFLPSGKPVVHLRDTDGSELVSSP